jgi:hypothetical protein
MLVPEKPAQLPSRAGTEDRIWTPGAVTSGFIWSVIGVGPLEEKPASRPSGVEAAAVIAEGDDPGEETDPRPKTA